MGHENTARGFQDVNGIRFEAGHMLRISGVCLTVLVAATALVVSARQQDPPPEVHIHQAKKEVLKANVAEKGVLESSAYTDLFCKVRSGTKGFAAIINTIIDDGSRVNPGDLLMVLDDSALKEQQEDQEITTARRHAEFIKIRESISGKDSTDLLKAQFAVAQAVYDKEKDKLHDIIRQREACRILAPPNIRPGSVVNYFHPENNRFAGAQLEQGAQVKEGQKLLRIPNLQRMQVNTKIIESLVTNVRADVRIPTHISELFQCGMCSTNLEPFGRSFSTSPYMLELISSSSVTNDKTRKATPVRDLEFNIKEPGQRASVRIDALPDKRYQGHVKSISQIPSQSDLLISDVKLYPTVVSIDQEIGTDGKAVPISGEILKPGMTAEVTIDLGVSKQPVLTIPISAVVGMVEVGATRDVFVKTKTGYERRKIELGLFNEKMVEVRKGLAEGDDVVTNPKAVLPGNPTTPKGK